MKTRRLFHPASLVVALIVAVIGLIAWRVICPDKFTAQARLYVSALPPKLSLALQTVESAESAGDYKRFQSSQQQMLLSAMVLNAALRDENVARYRMIRDHADPIEWLKEQIKVDFVAGSEVMEISLSGDDPVEIAGIVNAVMRAYVDEVANFETTRRSDRHERLRTIQEKYRKVLDECRKKLRALSDVAVGDDRLRITGLQKADLLRLHQALWSERLDLQLKRTEAEALLAPRKKAAGPAPDRVRTELEQLEERIAGLVAQEKFADERLEEMSREIRKQSEHEPEQEQLRAEIAQIEDVYRKLGSEIEALNVELQAPPRVRVIENATPPLTRGSAFSLGR
jgi:hypothetical protein